jgi:hypothetical protein
MLLSQVARVHARAAGVLHERNERAHLIDREPELTAAADKCQSLDVGVGICPLPSRSPVSLPQQSNFFIVANGRSVGTCAGGEGANPEVWHGPNSSAGRAYAAYGGVYIAVSLLWLWAVEGVRPDRWDLAGAAICMIGAAVILYGARG